MRHLVIRNIGPLDEVDINLAKVNVIIGPQSSGKSCVLKIACYCTWVEKKIELAQSADMFMVGDYFIKELTRFHKLNGYFRDDSFISYESEYTKFSYSANNGEFQFEWKKRWDYLRPKVSYIPAERNMVAAIPNWFDVKLYDDNIQSFMAEWDRARKSYTEQLDIMNLGVSYKYDEKKNMDQVKVGEGTILELTNTSSGLQSLIPLFVHLSYLRNEQKEPTQAKSVTSINVGQDFLKTMYDELYVKAGKTGSTQHGNVVTDDGKHRIMSSVALAHIGPYLLMFSNQQYAEECRAVYDRYVKTHHAELFLEEPENNLFPPTQTRLVDWLMKMTEGEQGATLFVATHSPYMMTALLEKEMQDFKLFFVKNEGPHSTLVTASEADVQEIYDDGIDAFYNIESYV